MTAPQTSGVVNGFWRRIKLFPAPGVISAGVEDDFHCFLLRLRHSAGVVTQLDTAAQRFPWATCADAGAFLTRQVVGQPMTAVSSLDAHSHCTHLFELLALCAAHALDRGPTQFDLRVADRVDQRTCATLSGNGEPLLHWDINGLAIVGPGEWAGRDLRQFSAWKKTLSPAVAQRAMLLRRAVHVSNARGRRGESLQRAADRGAARMGACFTYQMPRALEAWRSPDGLRDFAATRREPLQDFEPSSSVSDES